MKTILTLAISTFLFCSLNVSAHSSDFNVRLFNNQPIIVQFDHNNYNQPTRNFSLNYIEAGRHHLAIWSAPAYAHYGYNERPVLLYDGFVDLHSSSITSAVLTRNQFLRIENIEPKNCEEQSYNLNDPCNNYPDHNYNNHSPVCVSENQFTQIKNTIASKSFDSTRLEIAKQAVRTNPMNSKQIAELMQLLSFESSRMDFAKFAYKYTVDQQNYFLTYDQFSFESSVTELNDFISRHS